MSERRIWLYPSGLSGVHAAVVNVINDRHNGLLEQARQDIRDLALFSGIPDLYETLEKFDEETDFGLQLIDCEKGYSRAEDALKRPRKL